MAQAPRGNLSAILDGGPHDDPREVEEEELLNDGEEEVKEPEEDDNWDFGQDGEATGKKSAKPAEKPAQDKEPDKKAAKPEAEPEEEEAEPAEEKVEAEPDKKPDAKTPELDEEGLVIEAALEKDDPKTANVSVPYKRFGKVIQERNAERLRSAELARSVRELQERLTKFEATTKKAAEPEPDAQLDPVGHLQWQVKQQAAQIEALKPQAQAQTADLAPEEAAAIHDVYRESVDAFVPDHPEFAGAYQFIVNRTDQQLRGQFPTATVEQRTAMLQQMELKGVKQFIQSGQDPAVAVLNLAASLGYRVPMATGAQRKMAMGTGTETAKDRALDAATEAARKKRASTIAGSGRVTNRRPLTEADIDGMSNDETVGFMDRNSGRSNPLNP